MDIELLKSLEADADKLRSPWSNLGELGVDGLSSFLKTFGGADNFGDFTPEKILFISYCSFLVFLQLLVLLLPRFGTSILVFFDFRFTNIV